MANGKFLKKTEKLSGLYEKLLLEPEIAVEKLDLIYVGDEHLTIARQREKNDFIYLRNGRPVKNKEHLGRIKKLVIPPAWDEVKISEPPNGHLQAIGKDAKRRKQYRYHPFWNKVRNQTKFYKMTAFGGQLQKIRARVDQDLNQDGWPKPKVLALIIRLMEETHIRIGNEQYAKRNRTYGLSTLRKRHLDVFKGKLKFEFTGKKGKKHSVTLRNKRLVKLVSKCQEIPGWELFKFYDDEGNRQQIDSGMVNDYIHEISGALFTAKDFRTWSATLIFFETLLDVGVAERESDRDKNLLRGYDAAALELGNTRNVCRKYYVHPLVAKSYQDGSITEHFNKIERTKDKEFFTASETVLLKMLEDYRPKLTREKV